MPCFHPLEAWFEESGRITCNRAKARGPMFYIACKHCIGCRTDKQRSIALRLHHEKKMHRESAFLTLTYDDANLPEAGTLVKRHLQLFMMRLRKESGRGIRFFGCGEYGETFKRPHYHVILFNRDFADKKYWRKARSGLPSYRSAELEKLWTLGASEVMDVTEQSCAYVASYVCKKMTGKKAEAHYQVLDADGVVHQRLPEFSVQSMRPYGIGGSFFDKFQDEIVNNDCCIWHGKEVPVPAYYYRRLKEKVGVDFDWFQHERSLEAGARAEATAADRTAERLSVREIVLRAAVDRGRKPLD